MTNYSFIIRNGKCASALPLPDLRFNLNGPKKLSEAAVPYLLLVVEPVQQRASRTQEEGREAYRQMGEFADGLRARGLLQACESLTSLKDATRVAGTNDALRITDGPFAEAKEMIGGFFLLSCESREEAVAIAAECPAANWCTIEVRKIGPCYF
jgi:hypothetical protein